LEKLEGGALDAWDSLYRINLRTAVVACKTALPYLLKSGKGRIVNIGAMGAAKAGPGMDRMPHPRQASPNSPRRWRRNSGSGSDRESILPSTIDTPRTASTCRMLISVDGRTVRHRRSNRVSAVGRCRRVTGALIPVRGAFE